MYAPFHNKYVIGSKIIYKNLEIGVEHMCGHIQLTPPDFDVLRYQEFRERAWVKVSSP